MQVLQIASIAYFAEKNFNLLVLISGPQVAGKIKACEKRFNVDGLCVFVEYSKVGIDLIRQCEAAIVPPGVVDDPLRFALAKEAGLNIICRERGFG